MISSIQGAAHFAIEPGAGIQSLDDRMRDAFTSSSVDAQRETAQIVAMANDPAFLSDPGNLLQLQIQLGDYRQKVELISALARKGVGIAETVLRA